MEIKVVPSLHHLLDIYSTDDRLRRYEKYQQTMTSETETFGGSRPPFGAFSPMGETQPDYLNTLISQSAEQTATATASQIREELDWLPDQLCVVLVIVDDKPNGWTPRWVTDAEWRFLAKYDAMAPPPSGFDRWVTVQLWTDHEPTPKYVEQELRAAVYRAAYRRAYGPPNDLEAILNQEGNALRFAGVDPVLDPHDVDYSRQVLEPLHSSERYPVWVSAYYGDAVARSIGYGPLGLSDFAGRDVAVTGATASGALNALGL